jgi:hypothetical protein
MSTSDCTSLSSNESSSSSDDSSNQGQRN